MQSTGIIKAIDFTGRVVIPKDIRRNMKLHEGDLLEVYTEGEFCCFKKYIDVPNVDNLLEDLSRAIKVLPDTEAVEVEEMRRHVNILKGLFELYKNTPEEI